MIRGNLCSKRSSSPKPEFSFSLSKSFAKVLTFSHSVGRAGNGWEGFFSGLFQIPHNHLDLGGSEIPFFYVRIVALARKGLHQAGRFADFDQKTVVGRLGVVVGIVQLGELAFEYGSVEIHDRMMVYRLVIGST